MAVASFPLWRPEFDSGSVHEEFVVDNVVLGWVFSQYLGFPSIFIPPTAPHSLIIPPSIPHSQDTDSNTKEPA
jgi:hypothetical protein